MTRPTLPVRNGDDITPTPADYERWRKAYPSLDIERELAAISSWLHANPESRWTVKGWMRGVNKWLTNEHNRDVDRSLRDPAKAKGGKKKHYGIKRYNDFKLHHELAEAMLAARWAGDGFKVPADLADFTTLFDLNAFVNEITEWHKSRGRPLSAAYGALFVDLRNKWEAIA